MDQTISNNTPEKPLVLSVDDEPNVARAVKRTLRRASVDVVTAESGAEGLRLMESHCFDVIISDMRMPEMTGAKFLAQAALKQPDCKRVLLTGYADIESTIEAINEGGVSTYLTKPWEDEKLISVVEEAVQLKKLQARNTTLESLKAELEAAVTQLSESQNMIVAILGNAIDLRDKVGIEFNEPMLDLAILVGQHLGLESDEIEHLKIAITLHRIGRMSIPDHLLSTPYKEMTHDERELFDQHPVYADAVLMALPELQPASVLIRHQNEFWEGSGKPDGLSAEEIPLGSSILAIVRDYFDMQAGLYQKERMSPQEALEAVKGFMGKRYSPSVVDAFNVCVPQVSEHSDNEEQVELKQLMPGMKLVRDLKTADGVLLLGKGQELSNDLIKKIGRVFKSTEPGPIYVNR